MTEKPHIWSVFWSHDHRIALLNCTVARKQILLRYDHLQTGGEGSHLPHHNVSFYLGSRQTSSLAIHPWSNLLPTLAAGRNIEERSSSRPTTVTVNKLFPLNIYFFMRKTGIRMKIIVTESLLRARHCSLCFPLINSVTSHYNSMREALFLFPF